ncbi:MAG: general secretion pathway protein GspK [Bryobacteraceae bacterium]
MATTRAKTRIKGGALLAVLWLSAALAAVAFSLANTVRGEVERAGTAVDGARAYYLAAGGVERTILHMLNARWGTPYVKPTAASFDLLEFPAGQVHVAIVPETAKMNVNTARPEDLFRLFVALEVPPERAREIAIGIVAQRTPGPPSPTFQHPRASFEEIEELLSVPGMTPEIFYGTYQRREDGALAPRGGAADCLSVFGTQDRFDANSAHPAVLAAAGLPPDIVAAVVARRAVAPFANDAELAKFLNAGPALGRLRVGGNSIFTLRATARLRLADGRFSDVRRSVGAMVKFMPAGYDAPYHILRWYDTAWSQ